MNDLRTAAQQALEALGLWATGRDMDAVALNDLIFRVEDALAEPTGKDSLQVEPTVAENATAEFDHSVGADRFRVVRGAFWWHVLIGDSTTEHGKFRTKASAEKMAADLLREFRNGAFVQHQGGGNLPPPLQEATVQQQIEDTPPSDYRRGYWDGFNIGKREGRIAAEDALAEPEHEIITRMRRLKAEAEAEHRQALEQGKCSSCGQELPEELKTQYLVNHDLPIGCDHCNHPLWCGTKCKSCGRKA